MDPESSPKIFLACLFLVPYPHAGSEIAVKFWSFEVRGIKMSGQAPAVCSCQWVGLSSVLTLGRGARRCLEDDGWQGWPRWARWGREGGRGLTGVSAAPVLVQADVRGRLAGFGVCPGEQQFCSQGTFSGHTVVLLASSGERPGVLLHTIPLEP